MAQVDHDLTIVNCFDQQLGLIKNLGRHRPRRREPRTGRGPHAAGGLLLLPRLLHNERRSEMRGRRR
jgi:hypothetical protein